MKTLIVEDNLIHLEKLKNILIFAGYDVNGVSCVKDALTEINTGNYSVLILDFIVTDGTAIDILRYLRDNDLKHKVLIITGNEDIDYELNALDYGVVNYIHKPVSAKILIKRLELLISSDSRRTGGYLYCEIDNIKLSINERKVYKNNELIPLTGLEFDMLKYLLLRKNTLVTREDLFHDLWDDADNVNDRSIDVYIRRIRKKLDLTALVTIRGRGYEWTDY